MKLSLQFSEQELEPVNERRKELGCIPHSVDLAALTDFLSEMNVSGNVTVDLLRFRDGSIICGGKRLPLVVQNGSAHFVWKPYDGYDPEREKAVLRAVQGKIAPVVYYFANASYAEELIEPSESRTLHEMADDGDLELAIRMGAQAHAVLASMSILYAHNHWLDEFHFRNNKIIVTDFGTSRFFRQLRPPSKWWMVLGSEDICGFGQYWEITLDPFVQSIMELEDTGIEDYVHSHKSISLLTPDMPHYSEALEQLASVQEVSSRMLNIFEVLSWAALGIREYFIIAGYDNEAAERQAKRFTPVLVGSFAEKYARERQGIEARRPT